MKTENRIIAEYLYELLQEMLEADYDESAIELIRSKIELLSIEEPETPQDIEDEKPWNESSVITDMDINHEESIEDEHK